MDYFLFNFSGVQFHYTMSHLNNIYEPNNDPTADTFDNNKERFKTLYGKKYICEEKL